MVRTLYLLGAVYVAVCGVVLLAHPSRRPAADPPPAPRPAHPMASFTGSAAEWFQAVKPYCNAVEAGTVLPRQPPPAGTEGAGYLAACYSLAGKIAEARQTIDALPQGDRPSAANIVFNIGHPVADAGDDRSAGPIMELVLEYWPSNYMAVYHAGMSEFALGQSDAAQKHLRSFLDMYHENDGWRQSAINTLAKLDGR